MAMASLSRRALQRVGAGMRLRRGFADSRGVLSEEEKAAENIYIKRMEEERAEKLRQGKLDPQAAKEAAATSGFTSGYEKPKTEEAASLEWKKAVAFGGAVVAFACAFYWAFSKPPGSKKKEED